MQCSCDSIKCRRAASCDTLIYGELYFIFWKSSMCKQVKSLRWTPPSAPQGERVTSMNQLTQTKKQNLGSIIAHNNSYEIKKKQTKTEDGEPATCIHWHQGEKKLLKQNQNIRSCPCECITLLDLSGDLQISGSFSGLIVCRIHSFTQWYRNISGYLGP